MYSLEKVRAVGVAEPKFTINLQQLNLNENYNIIKAEKCDTVYGERILLELENCKVYLPKRFADQLDYDEIKNLSKYSMELVEYDGSSYKIDFHNKSELNTSLKLSPVKLFQSVGQKQKKPQKPIKSLKQLQLKEKYNILNAKLNSQRVIVELEDCKVNLPKRFSTDLAEADIKELPKCSMELLEPMGNSFSINFHEKVENKMCLLDKIKAIGLYKQLEQKPLARLRELDLHKRYNILSAQKCDTLYGEQIMVEFEDCKAYLPKRFTSSLDDEEIMSLSKCSMELLEPDGWSFKIDFHEKEEVATEQIKMET